MCDFLYYGDDARAVYALLQCINHEEKSNEMQFSTPSDKVSLVLKIQKAVPGGDWDLVLERILKVLGPTRHKTVKYVWIVLARDLPEAIHERIKVDKKIHAKHLINKYMTGRGENNKLEEKFKLKTSTALKALDILHEKRAANPRFPAAEFEKGVCLPLKAVAGGGDGP